MKIESTLQAGRPSYLDESPKEEADFLESIEIGFDKTQLGQKGIVATEFVKLAPLTFAPRVAITTDIEEQAYKNLTSKYDDYEMNQDAYNSLSSFSETDHAVMNYVKSREIFKLNKSGQVVPGSGYFTGADYIISKDKIKGTLLAEKHGFSDKAYTTEIKRIDKELKAKLEEKDVNPVGAAIGALGSYFLDPHTAVDFASPGRIVGNTVVGGAVKAFVAEGMYAGVGEGMRQTRAMEYKQLVGESYGLWDATKQVLVASGIGGVARAVGSIVNDVYNILKSGSHILPEDRAIMENFIRQEEHSMADSVVQNEAAITKASAQLDNGEAVDVSDIATKHPEDLADPEVEAVNLYEEANAEMADHISINKAELEVEASKAVNPEDDYFGMDKEYVDDALTDPEIAAELKALDEEFVAYESKEIDTGSDEYGEMMAEADAPNPQGFQAKTMDINGVEVPKTQFDLIQKYQKNRKWNRENPASKREIPQNQIDAYTKYSDVADDMEDLEFKEGGTNVFAKFGDNILAGTVAGVETDEQGNITFDPAKFVAGLGGYTAAKAAIKSLAKDGRFKQEILDYAERRLDEFENTRVGKAVTGKQDIIERQPGEKLLDYHKRKKQFKSELDVKKNQANAYKEAEDVSVKRTDTVDRVEISDKAKELADDDYKMQHSAPEPEGANSGADATDVFPDSPSDKNFERYYGTGNKIADKESIAAMKKMEGNPNAKVKIYRAIPKDIDADINEGDWITLSYNYAKEHGEAHLEDSYKILEKEVTAKDVYTNGDSINEWGYYPQGSN